MKSHKGDRTPAKKTSARGPLAADRKTITPAKRWFFRISGLLLPFVLVGGMELILRITGFGYDTHFFKQIRINESEYLVENEKFGLRFFPSSLARSPAPTVMLAKKPPGTCRILIFGESAALGDPRPAFGAGRYLQALLRERFPNRNFEVVCVAMTAINSHVLVEMAHECVRYEGDIWIVYLGNNEMVGPYGAATVFGAKAPPRFLVRLSLGLQRLRLGQLFARLGERLQAKPGTTWGGMEMFVKNRVPPGASRRKAVYESYRKNLEEILHQGRSSGAKVLLNTVAVNLKDCPPFTSMTRTNFSAEEKLSYQDAVAMGLASAARNDFAEAQKHFARAGGLDPSSAEIQYRWAESLFRSGELLAAREHYQNACDDDALPFRADTTINQAILQIGQTMTNGERGMGVFDAARFFAGARAGESPGDEWFYEHVHFNFDGNYKLARGWAGSILQWVETNQDGKRTGDWASQETCERRLGLTDWNRASVLEDVIRRLGQPPFTGQLGNAERIGAYRRSLAELNKKQDAKAAQAAREVYREAIGRAERDNRLRENYAEFLEGVGDLAGATEQWQKVAELTPQHHLGFFQAGRILSERGKLAEGRNSLTSALALRPDLSEGWLELGKLDIAEGKFDVALLDLERARVLLPEDFRVYYQKGRALSKLSRRDEAIQNFRQAVTLRPNYWQARYALGEELAFAGQDEEAIKEFQKVLQAKPGHLMSHLNMGVGLFKSGRLDEAKKQFEEVLRLDPQNRLASDYLKQVEKATGQTRSP